MPHMEHVNPRDDVRFVALVDRLATGVRRPEDLEARLRATYPGVVVRARELSGEAVEVWYVYRDGSWVPPPSVEPPAG
jgi:hypothetical protein